jgi:hypothetical protein
MAEVMVIHSVVIRATGSIAMTAGFVEIIWVRVPGKAEGVVDAMDSVLAGALVSGDSVRSGSIEAPSRD